MLIARLVVLELWNCKLAYFFYFFLSFFPFRQSTFGGPAFSDLQVCTFVHMMCPWSRCCRLCCATNNAMTPDSVTLLLLYVDVAVCRPVFCVSASAAVLSVFLCQDHKYLVWSIWKHQLLNCTWLFFQDMLFVFYTSGSSCEWQDSCLVAAPYPFVAEVIRPMMGSWGGGGGGGGA